MTLDKKSSVQGHFYAALIPLNPRLSPTTIVPLEWSQTEQKDVSKKVLVALRFKGLSSKHRQLG